MKKEIVHYLKTEKTKLSACGRVNQQINFFSTDWKDVTCKNCLKKQKGDGE